MPEAIIREGVPRPKIGVVLGSGGVKSMGGVELFDQLFAREIPVDLIVGCSGGAVVGAMVAMGYAPQEARMLATSLYTPQAFSMNLQALGGMLKFPFMHFDESMAIFKGSPLEELFQKIFQGRHIEESQIPLCIQATDLQTGEGVTLTSGDCAKAVQASSAAVPFLPPCLCDDRWLVDGAFSQSLPIMEAVRRDMDIIIAMSFDEVPQGNPTTFLGLASHIHGKAQRNAVCTQTGRAITFHHHEVIFVPLIFEQAINLWEAQSIPLVYEKARDVVAGAMTHIEKAINDFYNLRT